MAVAKRASQHSSYGGSCTTPTALSGDVITACVLAFYTGSATFTPPSSDGWSQFATGGVPDLGHGVFSWALFWKASAGSESGTKTWTIGGGGGDHLIILTSLSGADTTAPFQAAYQTSVLNDGSSVNYSFSSLTIDRAGSSEFVFGLDFGGGGTLYPSGSTWITVGSLTGYENTGSDPGETAAWYLATATGASIATITRGSGGSVGELVRFAIQPPGGGGSASDPPESAAMRQLRQNAIYRMSPRSEREAQQFLRSQKRAYGFAATA